MNNRFSLRADACGVALVLVLAFLVIITGLVIAFFTTVTTELSSAKGYEGEATARQLGDSAVQTVIASINQATDTHNVTLHGTTPVAWASQPGMIWNYDSANTPVAAYKLYSSDNMVVPQTDMASAPFDASKDVAAGWSAKPSLYTDLNSPVTTAAGAVSFPIIDGNNVRSLTVDSSTTPQLTYSSNGTTQDVAGFSVDPNKVTFSPSSTPSSTNNPVPMPTKWLYVLKNGALIAADSASTTTATFTSSSATKRPTVSNPIVGRVAYWTDDETCKVNINTAAEGTFWDTPRGQSYAEQAFAISQPVQHEFQRYPGHPATVSLSAVFPTLAGNLAQIYSMVPRIAAGGSNGGTVTTSASPAPTPIIPDSDRLYASVDELMFAQPATAPGPMARAVNPIPTPSNSTERQVIEQKKFFLTARSVAPELNEFDLPRIACWPLYKTTNSTYDSNDPPLYDSSRTTAYDRLIGTCSTINNFPYFFQRQLPLDPTNDINIPRNLKLYSYLQALTAKPFPGFTGDFLSKYPVPTTGAANRPSDRDQILTEIFDYVRSTNLYDDVLYNKGVPINGVQGVPFTPASGAAGHGFVAPIHFTPSGSNGPTQGFGRAYTLSEFGIGFICNAVAATSSTANDDYGSNDPTKNRVLGGSPINSTPGSLLTGGTALATGEKYIQAIILMEFFSPMQGFTTIQPDMQVEITGLDGLSVTTTDSGGNAATYPLSFPADGTTPYKSDPVLLYSGMDYGGNPGWRYTLLNKLSTQRGNLPADTVTATTQSVYPFISVPVKIKASNAGGTMAFNGSGNIQVKMYAGSATTPPASTSLMQTINVNLPSTTASTAFPIPNLVTQSTAASLNAAHATAPQNWWTFARGYNEVGYTSAPVLAGSGGTYATADTGGRLFTSSETSWLTSGLAAGAFFFNDVPVYALDPTTTYAFDVVRTVYPSHGDYRLVAGLNTVPNTLFTPHAYYNTSGKFMASSLSNSYDPYHEQGIDLHGKFFSNFNYGLFPDIPSNATQTPQTMNTMDVDSGTPNCVDGAYINKPDEGNVRTDGGLSYYANPETAYVPGPTYFTPNRIMISPGMFGSLPTGVEAGTPWQTLLFRPQPSHPQSSTVPPYDTATATRAGTAPDHLFMDLFWMPVVEPYAISDRFSTAGKINMNYQIAPFTYITRNTALRALFKNEQMDALVNGSGDPTKYTQSGFPDFRKSSKTTITSASPGTNIRHSIDAYQTLLQFDKVFSNGQLFRSASQICDLYIVPQANSTAGETAQTPQSMKDYWMTTAFPSTTGHAATGDNLRERIYTTLYPRLTTKSNTFTVHFRAQALKQSPSSATAGTWNETSDTITGDYRGSSVIERYIDPSDTRIPDYAAGTDPTTITPALNNLYAWRVVENHRFAP